MLYRSNFCAKQERDMLYGDGGGEVVLSHGCEEAWMDRRFGASSSSSHPLHLHDANIIAATFVSHHNMEDLSTTLQYIREQLEVDLTPFHFHALLRTFSYHRDAANTAQLLEVMMQSGLTTLETYARIVDCIHALSPAGSLALILQLVSLAQDGFGTLTFEEVAGSEGHTIALYAAETERHHQAAASPPLTSSHCTCHSAPLLSSLLHHLATTADGNPVMCFLVALWIQALGVSLGDWDVVHLLCSLYSRIDEFPRLCAALGNFHAFPPGSVSVEAVVRRLEKLGEIPPSLHGEVKSSESPLAQLVASMLSSLSESGVDLAATVVSGWINVQTNSVSELVARALRGMERSGVGPHQYNAGHLYHTLTLLHSTLRDDTAAVQVLTRAAAAAAEQRIAREEMKLSPHSVDAALATSACGAAAVTTAREAFEVPVLHLMDIGSLFSRVSYATLRVVQLPYCQVSRMLVNDFAEEDVTVMRKLCCAPVPTARSLMCVGGYEAFFIRDATEARTTLQRAMEAIGSSSHASKQRGGPHRLPRHTQLMLMQLVEFCSRHPPRNPKYTAAGLEERKKWARYLDARDTSLALFGSSRQSRDSMKHLFYHDNALPELRSASVIAQDFNDAHRIFFSSSSDGEESSTSTANASLASLQHTLRHRRTTVPHTGCHAEAVPRYLWDTSIPNPYPHVMVCGGRRTFNHASGVASPSHTGRHLSEAPASPDRYTDDAKTAEEEEETQTELENFFVELWEVLLDKTTVLGSNEVWFLQNTDMFLLLIRCLLHRLDWEAAAHLTRRMTVHSTYTYAMDQELTTIFKEVGDPAGCLAFKVATKLFDGRITKDGQTKREKFQEEQFS